MATAAATVRSRESFSALLDGSGNPVDGDPHTSGVQPATTTTDSLGGFRFDNLFPGAYQVRETQPSGYGSVSDVDGGNPDIIGNITAISVAPGQDVTGRDFIEIELGAISGYVYAGSTPLAGVTLTLLDGNGDPVDGDPNTPGVQPVTTVTSPLGYYSFTGVVPGTYQVAQTQPAGYDSFGDIDGGDINIIGDITPITLLPASTARTTISSRRSTPARTTGRSGNTSTPESWLTEIRTRMPMTTSPSSPSPCPRTMAPAAHGSATPHGSSVRPRSLRARWKESSSVRKARRST